MKKEKILSNIKTEYDKLWIYFLSFAIMGWIYEVCIMHFEMGYGFINRGFLFGPYIPLYGCGGLFILAATHKIRSKKIKILGINISPIVNIVLIMIISTLLELITSYTVEWILGERLWDYTYYGPNFQGRIALKSTLQFGLLGLVGLYVVYPLDNLFIKKTKGTKPILYNVIVYTTMGIFAADLIARIFLGSNYTGP